MGEEPAPQVLTRSRYSDLIKKLLSFTQYKF